MRISKTDTPKTQGEERGEDTNEHLDEGNDIISDSTDNKSIIRENYE